ncbi:peptidylprolyl isomerase [Frigoribacterium faeni]|uniref:peptidylprolyl isomerase n=1 Tax=Frigoribacterium faeni TaxID=145483 RepID=A0A7W3PIJ2_9MICO|nr:peptidylprolyl isomerase [Frigoribacterium faeni]MBA8812832.1 peptidyl-prolyl cis-trans isomerase B (cyclophilin B) [Frigoribacterium faeni]
MAPSRDDREARDRLRRYNARQKVHSAQVGRRRRDNVIASAAVLVVIALAVVTQVVYTTSGPGAPEASSSPTPSPSASATSTGDVPSSDIAEDRVWTGELDLNDDVELAISLDGEKAPQAASVVIDLIQQGFYDGTACHRLSDADSAEFLQCGSANGDGTGDAGFTFGPLENVPSDGLYPAGTIAMARGSDPNSQSTQFFITYGDTYLDASTGGYTIVGSVTDGLDQLVANVADAGVVQPEGASQTTDGAPVVDTTITAASIE